MGMTKGWKKGLKGLSSFRSLSWLSEVEERGSIHVSKETSKVGYLTLMRLVQRAKWDIKKLCFFFLSLVTSINTECLISFFQKENNVLFYYQSKHIVASQ